MKRENEQNEILKRRKTSLQAAKFIPPFSLDATIRNNDYFAPKEEFFYITPRDDFYYPSKALEEPSYSPEDEPRFAPMEDTTYNNNIISEKEDYYFPYDEVKSLLGPVKFEEMYAAIRASQVKMLSTAESIMTRQSNNLDNMNGYPYATSSSSPRQESSQQQDSSIARVTSLSQDKTSSDQLSSLSRESSSDQLSSIPLSSTARLSSTSTDREAMYNSIIYKGTCDAYQRPATAAAKPQQVQTYSFQDTTYNNSFAAGDFTFSNLPYQPNQFYLGP